MKTARATGRTLVFLGPSLSLAEAQRICPDAEFHPPIRFGDLYALACEPPGQVLIIDGVFHDSTPVWQREILDALQAGWRVLGASSMGALRALELEPYGMIGLGTIFEWYRTGRIEGDDEVALLHGVAEMDYRPLTLPLVDVRHVLAELEAEDVLTPPQVSTILSEFKCMGHETRTLNALLGLVQARGGEVAEVRRRLSDSRRSLKAQDARRALRILANDLPLPAAGRRWPDPTPPPVEPQAVLERVMHPLAGPPIRVADALQALARRPAALVHPVRESRRRWFLRDWSCIAGTGPDANGRKAFARRHAGGLARELGVALAPWCAASALRENELPEWTAGLAIEAWLTGRTAAELGVANPPHVGDTSVIPLVLVDWMRRQGVEAPPEYRASAGRMATWLVQTGPEFFGSVDFHADTALVKTLAVNGDLARWGRSAPVARWGRPAPAGAESEGPP